MIRRTPGPWRVSRSWNGQQLVVESTNGAYRVASVQWPEDARLMAAAPVLLDALVAVLESLTCEQHLAESVEDQVRRAVEEAGVTVTHRTIDIVSS